MSEELKSINLWLYNDGMHRTIRYRLHLGSKRKHDLLPVTAGGCRFVWNWEIAKPRNKHRRTVECSYSFLFLGPVFSKLRHDLPWLEKYAANSKRTSLKSFDVTNRKFFKALKENGGKREGLASFHGKHRTIPGFPLTSQGGTFCIAGERIHVGKTGWMKLGRSNPRPDCVPESGTIKQKAGKWYVNIVNDVKDEDSEQLENPIVGGIDRNVGQVALSIGRMVHVPKGSSREAKHRRHKRIMPRRFRRGQKRQSNCYLFARRHHAKTVQKLTAIRLNWVQKTSRRIANRDDIEILEKEFITRAAISFLSKARNGNNVDSCETNTRAVITYPTATVAAITARGKITSNRVHGFGRPGPGGITGRHRSIGACFPLLTAAMRTSPWAQWDTPTPAAISTLPDRRPATGV